MLGLSDLAVDFIWIALRLRRRRDRDAALPAAARPGRLAIFVPAWDEAAVIGAMLDHAQAAFAGADHRIYVGCYPNDPATIAAVRAAAGAQVRFAIGPAPGPTSKADCLNRLWDRMLADEAAPRVCVFKAVVLHDAEDVVHSAELGLFDALVERFDLVQVPVLPLIDPGSRFVGGHYADEFAEAHGKELVVRQALGASLPSAGVGCAISRAALDALAADHGAPFDPDSLTEDYELGLRLHALGRPAAFVRLPATPGRAAIATREYFPGDARCRRRAKGALDDRHRTRRLGAPALAGRGSPSAGCGCATASRSSPRSSSPPLIWRCCSGRSWPRPTGSAPPPCLASPHRWRC